MGKLMLKFIGYDSWSRPVYENEDDGMLFVDTDDRKGRNPQITTKYNNEFDEEPDTPVEYINRYKNLEVVFIPHRMES